MIRSADGDVIVLQCSGNSEFRVEANDFGTEENQNEVINSLNLW